ncbi:UDP-N-acetylmuramoyl-L-alanine--D-glutamate ligase [Marinicella sp. S1101]|uniref:UDP-N-acetylmuramoyl-L-alanine--D-glutamate ligase n=1 Tax=Marinicella marina TaxID=2996016 RepID=UPI002260E2DD|nr:UDP-N-acetylmuramoyl-L-alanine--D-glutamate ligase [Marinicella marina]MCX7553935.1 UDP-N-acetylmuramoyl-L-alanine--D-glutamate ligase [Marinicella marina]
MKLESLKDKTIAIWGFGLEGKATLAYLLARCPNREIAVLCGADEVAGAQRKGVSFITEPVTVEVLDQFEVVVKSPGISPYQAPAKQAKCQFISSAALWFDNEKSGQIIAITGTKGKSTTAAMLTAVLEAMNFKVVLAGNFGLPLIQCLGKFDFVVLETSSYQAYDGSIKADIGVLLNLYSEHLNWHLTEQQYHHDKWQLLCQSERVLLNAADDNSTKMLQKEPLRMQPEYYGNQHGFYELNGVLMYQDKALVSAYGWQLKGRHNLHNAAAVCAIVLMLGLDIKIAINAIKQFKPLPHRLQLVAEFNGVKFINDSISSTPHSTLAAMGTVDLSRTILLVGGFDRGVDWQWWVEAIEERPPQLIICSGENSKKIHQLVLNQQIKTQCIKQPSLKQAVKYAKEQAQPGDTVLLSPGAPSFDAFDDYQHRGQKFSQWIQQ